MAPRQGYQSRTVVLAGLKATIASKPHAVHWRRVGAQSKLYACVCNCGWRLEGRYGLVREQVRTHLYSATPEKE